MKKTFDSYDPDQYQLLEGEERRYMDPESQKVDQNNFQRTTTDIISYCIVIRYNLYVNPIKYLQLPVVQEVLATLKSWVNNELGKEATRMQESIYSDIKQHIIYKPFIKNLG